MEKSNAVVGTVDSTAKTPTKTPVASVDGKDNGDSANGADKDVTLTVRCRITLRNGAVLFGGAEDGGGLLGRADGVGNDLVLEVEGTAGLSGGGTTRFGGAEDGGGLLGHRDTGGEGEPQRQSYPARTNRAGRRNGGSKAS
jgi:hypothetical protein